MVFQAKYAKHSDNDILEAANFIETKTEHQFSVAKQTSWVGLQYCQTIIQHCERLKLTTEINSRWHLLLVIPWNQASVSYGFRCTGWAKKSKPTLSTHNFVKYWPIFTVLSLSHSQGNLQ